MTSSGTTYSSGDALDLSETILIHDNLMKYPTFQNYATTAVHKNFANLIMGIGSFIRKLSLYNTERLVNAPDKLIHVPYPQTQALRPNTIQTEMLYFIKKRLVGGEEITIRNDPKVSSGSKRGTPIKKVLNEPMKVSMEILQQKGICLTDVYVNISHIPLAGKGVFSSRKFENGNLVTISPAIVVPKHLIREDEISVLLNYIFSTNNTDLALLPVGTAGMINHGNSDQVNVEVRWYDWHGRDVMSLLDTMDIEKELIGAKSARLFLGYYATRQILPGEELFISYGSKWEEEWKKYLNIMSLWLDLGKNNTNGDKFLNAPQFRHYIELPQQLVPSSFLNSSFSQCIGNLGCNGESFLARPSTIHMELYRDLCTRFDKESFNMALEGKIKENKPNSNGFRRLFEFFK